MGRTCGGRGALPPQRQPSQSLGCRNPECPRGRPGTQHRREQGNGNTTRGRKPDREGSPTGKEAGQGGKETGGVPTSPLLPPPPQPPSLGPAVKPLECSILSIRDAEDGCRLPPGTAASGSCGWDCPLARVGQLGASPQPPAALGPPECVETVRKGEGEGIRGPGIWNLEPKGELGRCTLKTYCSKICIRLD